MLVHPERAEPSRRNAPRFTRNERVRFNDGPYAGNLGIIIAVRRDNVSRHEIVQLLVGFEQCEIDYEFTDKDPRLFRKASRATYSDGDAIICINKRSGHFGRTGFVVNPEHGDRLYQAWANSQTTSSPLTRVVFHSEPIADFVGWAATTHISSRSSRVALVKSRHIEHISVPPTYVGFVDLSQDTE